MNCLFDGKTFVVSPMTSSGTIIVNNVVLSCYANIYSHVVANYVLFPVRAYMVRDATRYFATLTNIYNVFPRRIKSYIAASSLIVVS